MSWFAACCSCWRREGDHPYLPAPVPEAEIFSARAYGAEPPPACLLNRRPALGAKQALLAEESSPATASRSLQEAHVIHSSSVVPDVRGPMEELYDDDWSTLQLPSQRATQRWHKARAGIQTTRVLDSLLGEVREHHTSQLYEDDWSAMSVPGMTGDVEEAPRASEVGRVAKVGKGKGACQTEEDSRVDKASQTEEVEECSQTEEANKKVEAASQTEEVADKPEQAPLSPSRAQQHWAKARRGIKVRIAMEGVLGSARAHETEDLYEQDWTREVSEGVEQYSFCEAEAALAQGAASAAQDAACELQGAARESVHGASASAGPSTPAKEAASGAQGSPSPRSSRAIAHWQKAKRAIGVRMSLEGMLDDVRGKETEDWYDQDWTASAVLKAQRRADVFEGDAAETAACGFVDLSGEESDGECGQNCLLEGARPEDAAPHHNDASAQQDISATAIATSAAV